VGRGKSNCRSFAALKMTELEGVVLSHSKRENAGWMGHPILVVSRKREKQLQVLRFAQDDRGGRGRALPLKTQRARFEWGTDNRAITKDEKPGWAACPVLWWIEFRCFGGLSSGALVD
jgi:hypothetical protein